MKRSDKYWSILFLLFLLWLVAYNFGKPWNCQQATEELAETQVWAENVANTGNPNAYMGALAEVSKAESNRVRLCKVKP